MISRIPAEGVLRITIFGDSFTHGNDVPFNDTWGVLLERQLGKAGIHAEVLNFGVGGYGMDQSLLRWRQTGYLYEPDVVIFGLQVENINRNVNLARTFYFREPVIPFFNPRFVLEQGRLRPINTPTPPPEAIMRIVSHFDIWQNSKHEVWYDPGKYRDRLLFKSKLISFVYARARESLVSKKAWNGEDP